MKSAQQSEHQRDRGLTGNDRSNCRSSNHIRTKKIFVGGLPSDLTEEEFRSYFEKFGRITDVVVMHDSVTHRPRGFGFITFDSEDSVEEAVHNNFHQLNGKLVEVKRAVPKDRNVSNSSGHNGRIYGGRGPNDYWNPQGIFPPYDFRFQYSPFGCGYVAGYLYGTGMFGGGYPPGGCGCSVYGFPPTVAGSPYSHAMISNGASMRPYVSGAPVYPLDLNGCAGMTCLTASGYSGSVDSGLSGVSAQTVNQGADESTPSDTVKNNEDANSSSSGRDLEAAANELSQNDTNQASAENSS